MEMSAFGIVEEMKRLERENRKLRNNQTSDELHQLYCLIEGLSGVCRDDFDDLESFVDDVNQQIHDDQKQREREIEELQEWRLSDAMIEQTSAETIQEFEQDVRDNWDEIKELQAQIKKLNQQVGVLQRMNKRIRKALDEADAEQTDA